MLSAEEIAKRCAAVDALGNDACFVASCKAGGLDFHKDLRYGNWTGLDLSHEELVGCDFTGADVTGTNFSGARIVASSRLRGSLDVVERISGFARFDQAILGRVLHDPEREATLPANVTPVANLREALDWDIYCDEWHPDDFSRQLSWASPAAMRPQLRAQAPSLSFLRGLANELPQRPHVEAVASWNPSFLHEPAMILSSLHARELWPLHRFRVPAAAPDAAHLPIGAIFQDAPFAPEMVVVPPATFAPSAPSSDAEPRTVDIGRLAVGRFPVTLDEWNFARGTPEDRSPRHLGDFDTLRQPIAYVSLLDVTRRYLRALNERLGLGGESAYRLLTAAEWEYCCRGGTATTYCNGDDADRLDDIAWFAANSAGKPHPVGLKQPNAFGLHDMHGNVAELTREGDSEGLMPLAAACGGSFASQPDQLGCSGAEIILEYGSRRRDIGFRVARNLDV